MFMQHEGKILYPDDLGGEYSIVRLNKGFWAIERKCFTTDLVVHTSNLLPVEGS